MLRTLAASCLCLLAAANGLRAQKLPSPPLPAAEFRGAWVATVDNIDWPSKKGLPTAEAQRELEALIDSAAALRLNALVFQVRPAGDAFYASQLEPWSEWLTGEQGKAPVPAWDPLAFVCEKAHQKGLEVHAWFNPFRAVHAASKGDRAANHVTRTAASACVPYGKQVWMDPGDPRCVDLTCKVILDVVTRYDVDGIHLDDYFYPYPEKKVPFGDDASYRRYQQRGGKKGLLDWRRENIDAMVARIQKETHRQKPWVKFGISPFGIARPGVPKGIQAGIDQYNDLAADVLGWLARGDLDYLSPQLYWPIDQKAQSFATLLPWWHGQNQKGRHLWPGLNASRGAQGKSPWRDDELPQQIDLIRSQGAAPGHVHFSWKALKTGSVLRQQLESQSYREAAPVPASPWLGGGELPKAPELAIEGSAGAFRARVRGDANARFLCVQVLQGTRWRTLRVTGPQEQAIALPADARAVAVRGSAKNGALGPWKGLPVGE